MKKLKKKEELCVERYIIAVVINYNSYSITLMRKIHQIFQNYKNAPDSSTKIIGPDPLLLCSNKHCMNNEHTGILLKIGSRKNITFIKERYKMKTGTDSSRHWTESVAHKTQSQQCEYFHNDYENFIYYTYCLQG